MVWLDRIHDRATWRRVCVEALRWVGIIGLVIAMAWWGSMQ